MSIGYSLLMGTITYIFLYFIFSMLYKFITNPERKRSRLRTCLEKENFLSKISKKLYWSRKIEKIVFSIEYMLSGYDRPFMFWTIPINNLIRAVIFSILNTVVVWSISNIGIIKETWKNNHDVFKDIFFDIYEWCCNVVKWFDDNKIVTILLIALLAITVFRKYKRSFESIIHQKKNNELTCSLDLNCIITKELLELKYEMYSHIFSAFQGEAQIIGREKIKKDTYVDYVSNIIFEDIFYDTDNKNYIGFKRAKIKRIEDKISKKYIDSKESGNFYDYLIWAKYDEDILELTNIMSVGENGVSLLQNCLTDEWITNYISRMKKSWSEDIKRMDELPKEGKDVISKKYFSIIQEDIRDIFLETVITYFSMYVYINAVLRIMRVKNGSLLDGFKDAKQLF